MYTCAECAILACRKEDRENMPRNCPMNNRENIEQIIQEYKKDEIQQFHRTSSTIEKEGYCEWPRVRETIEFAKKMGYKKLGIAFCNGLKKEAQILAQLLRKNGFEVESVVCKAGGVDKSYVGLTDEAKLCGGGYEAMCNPIAQAQLLNQSGTEFNIVVGLCVGHDSLFYRYSDAMVTTLVAKDRALAHNPAAALYLSEGYLRRKVNPEQGE